MEKVRSGLKKTLALRVSLVRKAWVNIVLFLLAGVMIGSGVYFSSQPEWAKRADIITYNKGVIAYIFTQSGLDPSLQELPSEYRIETAAAYFQEAASISTDYRLKSLALYNLGTLIWIEAYALSDLTEVAQVYTLQQAITNLAEAVRLDPNNEDAKYNLELLEKVMPIEGQQQETTNGVSFAPGIVEKGF